MDFGSVGCGVPARATTRGTCVFETGRISKAPAASTGTRPPRILFMGHPTLRTAGSLHQNGMRR